MNQQKIRFSPFRIAVTLLVIDLILCIFSVFVWYAPRKFGIEVGKLYNLFYLDNEMNFPTFFSVFLMLTCMVMLYIITLEEKVDRKKYVRQWAFLALGFFVMAIDDFVSLHEKLMKPMNDLFGINGISYFLTFSWIVPYSILVVILAVSYFRFVRDLPRRSKTLFILAGIVYLAGVLGMEMVGGYVKRVFGMETREYVLASTCEEFLEMAGLVLFIYGLLDYMTRQMEQIHLVIGKEYNGAVTQIKQQVDRTAETIVPNPAIIRFSINPATRPVKR